MTYVDDAMLIMARRGRAIHDAAAGVLGSDELVSNVSMAALTLLHRDGPQRPTRIAELTGLTSGGATKLITRLETAGLVVRDADAVPADGRAIVVSLTPMGTTKMGEVTTAAAEHVVALIDALSELRADA